MSRRKGGFQVSISMIIGIVFAVLILGLGIMWISSTFGGIQTISKGLLEQSKNKILRGDVDRVDVVLPTTQLTRKKGVELVVLVQNRYDEPKEFKVVVSSLGGKITDVDSTHYGESVSPQEALGGKDAVFIISPSDSLLIGPVDPDEVGTANFKLIPNKKVKKLGYYAFKASVYLCDKDGNCPTEGEGAKLYKSVIFNVELLNKA